MIRVAIVAASELVGAGLSRMVAAHEERCALVATAASLVQLRAALDQPGAGLIDVVIFDPRGGEEAIAGAAAPLQGVLDAGVKLVVLSDDEPSAVMPLVLAGAAWLPSAAPANEILAAVEAVAVGLVALRSEALEQALQHPPGWFERRAAERIEPLTARELEVLRLLAEGFANKRIATTLRISEHTAKFHVGRILGKLDAATRAEAVAIGLRDGLIRS
jgi:DNA-binding NarL/FixJ family response regulator